MKVINLIILLFPTLVFAKFEVASKKVPSEIRVLFAHLNESELTPKMHNLYLEELQALNKDLIKISRANALFFLKSEFYRSMLSNPNLEQKNTFQVNTDLLNRAAAKLDLKIEAYSSLSQWIIKACLKDLEKEKKSGFIDTHETIRRDNKKLFPRALRLKKKLQFISPWLEEFMKDTPGVFNNFVTEASLSSLKMMTNKSHYFNKLSNKLRSEEDGDLFKLPKPMKEVAAPPAKNESEEFVKKLEIDDLSSASKEIDGIPSPLNTWTPKDD